MPVVCTTAYLPMTACMPVGVHVSVRHAMLSSNALRMPSFKPLCVKSQVSPKFPCSSKARWIYPLTDPRPLRQLYQRHQSAIIFPSLLTTPQEYIVRTMNSLPITPLFAIKHCIFILWSHLRLCRHLLFPPLQLRRRLHIVFPERIVDRCYYVVDETEAFALAALLGDGETPGYFPVKGWLLDAWGETGMVSVWQGM